MSQIPPKRQPRVQESLNRRKKDTASIDAVLRRELYFFTIYRAFEASLFAFVVFSPFAGDLVELRYPTLAQFIAFVYMMIALSLLIAMRRSGISVAAPAAVGLAFDIAVALFAYHVMIGGNAAISLLLLVNVSAGAVLLPMRFAAGFAIVASTGLLVTHAFNALKFGTFQGDAIEAIMFAITYLAAALLCHLLGNQLRTSVALADRRGVQVTHLAHLNEMIIRRMRTGVVVVDAGCHVRLMNEAAWHLLGGPRADQSVLADLSPALAERLDEWRKDGLQIMHPIALAADRQPVLPRIATISVTEELFVIFLDDSSLVSRRAEELTLSTLGRLSAGIAHEIRNPLAAIKHSAQLLEESPDLQPCDQRLIEIMLNQCNRMNGIVENVLGLARRERSQPEQVNLAQWARAFVADYRATRVHEEDYELQAKAPTQPLIAIIDPQQLHQVVTALVNNALRYGHAPGAAANVCVVARQVRESHRLVIEVVDRGPGIPAVLAARIFEPFYTTNELGNGLGLYLAQELCQANQATLDYMPNADGGSCFRITMASAEPLIAKAPVRQPAQTGSR